MRWFNPERRVLFVCTANVCRSPLAEAMLRHRLIKMGLGSRVQVRSAGTYVGQRGRRPDPRIKKLAEEAGISLGRIRATVLTTAMIKRSDYVLVMEQRHLDDMARLYGELKFTGNPKEKITPKNILLIGSFLDYQGDFSREIPDPYFGNWQAFVDVYALMDKALAGVAARIANDLGAI